MTYVNYSINSHIIDRSLQSDLILCLFVWCYTAEIPPCVPGVQVCVFPRWLRDKSRQVQSPINTPPTQTQGTRHNFGTVASLQCCVKHCTSYHMQLPINSWPVVVCCLRTTRALTDGLIAIYRRTERKEKKLWDVSWSSFDLGVFVCLCSFGGPGSSFCFWWENKTNVTPFEWD